MCVQCECKEAVAVVIQVFDNVCVFSGDKWQVRLQPPKPAGFEAAQIHAPITRDRLQRWYITIPSSDRWCTTIENHRYQWLSYLKTIGKPLIPMVALNHSIQW